MPWSANGSSYTYRTPLPPRMRRHNPPDPACITPLPIPLARACGFSTRMGMRAIALASSHFVILRTKIGGPPEYRTNGTLARAATAREVRQFQFRRFGPRRRAVRRGRCRRFVLAGRGRALGLARPRKRSPIADSPAAAAIPTRRHSVMIQTINQPMSSHRAGEIDRD